MESNKGFLGAAVCVVPIITTTFDKIQTIYLSEVWLDIVQPFNPGVSVIVVWVLVRLFYKLKFKSIERIKYEKEQKAYIKKLDKAIKVTTCEEHKKELQIKRQEALNIDIDHQFNLLEKARHEDLKNETQIATNIIDAVTKKQSK